MIIPKVITYKTIRNAPSTYKLPTAKNTKAKMKRIILSIMPVFSIFFCFYLKFTPIPSRGILTLYTQLSIKIASIYFKKYTSTTTPAKTKRYQKNGAYPALAINLSINLIAKYPVMALAKIPKNIGTSIPAFNK